MWELHFSHHITSHWREEKTNVNGTDATTLPQATSLDHPSRGYDSKNDNAITVLVPKIGSDGTDVIVIYPGILEQQSLDKGNDVRFSNTLK